MFPNTLNINNLGKTARLCSMVILLLLNSLPFAASVNGADGPGQEIKKLNRFVDSSDASDAAAEAFRKGRDLIEEEDWDEAADTFADFIDDYPKDKNVDAALYWLAFALKKQGRLQEVRSNLDRLIQDFPKSSWITDAKAMRVEVAGKTGDTKVINQVLEGDGSPEDETKIIALQSLFQADPERAAAYVNEILK
ncbi:MAG TPA: tetratricopeptide repeat protein, partial [Blastocatellia bacterium]|nr:tetratricopeptide repeat protein [Blastocatellia bacterium]